MKTLPLPTPDRPAVVMHCDVPGCLDMVKRAPRVVLPSKTPFELGHTPLKIMTTLHYCETHRGTFHLGLYWTDKIKRRAEDRARQIRPYGFRCDFEAARVEMVLVTTPEYRAFMRDLGINCVNC
jgi:hypothetical protein